MGCGEPPVVSVVGKVPVVVVEVVGGDDVTTKKIQNTASDADFNDAEL